jgi:DNA-binding transcriptional LysR family regulator
MEEIERQFQPVGRAIAGRLRADVPSRIARRLIAPALPEFLNDHPEIQVDLGSSDRIIDLVEEGINCALRVGELVSNSLVARPLGLFELINCASPAYLARQGTPRIPRDLDGHLAIDYVSSASGKADPWEWVENGETHILQVRSRVSVNNRRDLHRLRPCGSRNNPDTEVRRDGPSESR